MQALCDCFPWLVYRPLLFKFNNTYKDEQNMTSSNTSFIDTMRSFRVANIAVFDVVMSVYLLGYVNQRWGTGSFQHGAWAAIPLGIVVHMMLGIPTQLNHYLGLSAAPPGLVNT
jgi:hypothetical protein